MKEFVKHSPHVLYGMFGSYDNFRNWLLLCTYELNEMVRNVPIFQIGDFWLSSPLFRRSFKNVAYMAYVIHHEDYIQGLLPWCCVNLKEYAKRFAFVGARHKCSPFIVEDYERYCAQVDRNRKSRTR